MRKDRILVTGATGFTGGHLAERLARQGYDVRALVRDDKRCSDLRASGVEIVKGDLRDPESLHRATNRVDVVYHIAALFRQENVSRREMWANNVQGTKNLLDAATKAGVRRFVHCSTVGVHGDVKSPPANEEAPYRPGDHYQESKTEGERVVLKYRAEGRLPIVVFRPGGIYGPGDLRFLKLIKAVNTGRFVMLGSGKVVYQMIYIDDLIDGIFLCGTKEEALNNVFILTGTEPLTLNELVRRIAEVLGVPPPRLHFPVTPVYLASFVCQWISKPLAINPWLYPRRVDFFRKTRWFDISKAQRELGFSPKTNLKTGTALTVNWYQKQGYL
jgi:nucleoside-diphosphate-sugar epimerase